MTMPGKTSRAARKDGKGGMTASLQVGVAECSLGLVLVAASEQGVCAILLGDNAEALRKELASWYPRATMTEGGADFQKKTVAAVVTMVEHPEKGLDVPLDIRGTAFQRRVWEELRKVPPGTTTTYAALAGRLGNPNAARAVAGACASNPLSVVVPCHRVIHSDGTISGYAWGVARKAALLERERESSR